MFFVFFWCFVFVFFVCFSVSFFFYYIMPTFREKTMYFVWCSVGWLVRSGSGIGSGSFESRCSQRSESTFWSVCSALWLVYYRKLGGERSRIADSTSASRSGTWSSGMSMEGDSWVTSRVRCKLRGTSTCRVWSKNTLQVTPALAALTATDLPRRSALSLKVL